MHGPESVSGGVVNEIVIEGTCDDNGDPTRRATTHLVHVAGAGTFGSDSLTTWERTYGDGGLTVASVERTVQDGVAGPDVLHEHDHDDLDREITWIRTEGDAVRITKTTWFDVDTPASREVRDGAGAILEATDDVHDEHGRILERVEWTAADPRERVTTQEWEEKAWIPRGITYTIDGVPSAVVTTDCGEDAPWMRCDHSIDGTIDGSAGPDGTPDIHWSSAWTCP